VGFIDYLTKVIKKYLEHITNRARNIEITKTEYLSEKEAIDVLFTFECGDASMCDTLTIPTINLIKFHNKHNIDREKITMREWSRMCKRAFKPTENEDELVCRLNPGHTPFQDMVEAANERVLEKEKSLRKGIIFGDWDNLEKIYEEENNMRKTIYDVIIIDLPDPKTIELGRMYSKEFYRLCYKHLRPGGAMVTQAGSPYFATRAFRCIDKTVAAAGFETVQLHNQILTLGEWGWIMGVKEGTNERVKAHLHKLQFDDIETHWINNEAMKLITSFGKDYYGQEVGKVEVNKIHNPVLYKYYLNGNWDLY